MVLWNLILIVHGIWVEDLRHAIKIIVRNSCWGSLHSSCAHAIIINFHLFIWHLIWGKVLVHVWICRWGRWWLEKATRRFLGWWVLHGHLSWWHLPSTLHLIILHVVGRWLDKVCLLSIWSYSSLHHVTLIHLIAEEHRLAMLPHKFLFLIQSHTHGNIFLIIE